MSWSGEHNTSIWLLYAVAGSTLEENFSVSVKVNSPLLELELKDDDDLQYYTAWSRYTDYKSKIHFVNN